VFFNFIPVILQAQDWTKNLPQDKIDQPEELTFFEIQQAFNDYWKPSNVKNGYNTENGIEKKHLAGSNSSDGEINRISVVAIIHNKNFKW